MLLSCSMKGGLCYVFVRLNSDDAGGGQKVVRPLGGQAFLSRSVLVDLS